MQLPECPGPCNRRNRLRRRACVQHVESLLEGLPLCIRARLCPEDLATLCGRVSHKPRHPSESKVQNVSTNSEDLAEEAPETETEAAPERESVPEREAPLEPKVESSLDAEASEETKFVDGQQEATTQTELTRIYSMASRLVSVRSQVEHASIVLKNFAARLARIFSIATAGCRCRLISLILYAALALLVTRVAGNANFYELFLSSQICGIVAVLGWRMSGRVPI